MNNCKICNGSDLSFFKKGKTSYTRCRICLSISMCPEPTDIQIQNHYKKKFITGNYELLRRYDEEYKNIYGGFIKRIKKTVHHDGKQLKNMKVLDVGCFTGDFLYLASKEGCEVTGYELQKEAVEIANQKLPGKIHEVDVYNNNIQTANFDIVCLFGIVEHVLDPQKLIKRSYELLKPGGYLFIQTPNSASFLSRILGKYWPPISPIEHIHIFSKNSLTKTVNNERFSVVNFENHWKSLPIQYVYENLSNFGPEIKSIVKPFYWLLPKFVKNLSLPFYGGEMIMAAKKGG
mgnify:CR=1 FL=1